MPPQTVPDIGVSVLDLIGRTPLIRLRQFEKECPGVEICAKAEGQNPGGSVKDRAAARMIAEGEKSGALTPGLTILDATSGNTGIAYAMIGAARGYKVKLCVPENASPERKLILKAFGAELVLTESAREHRRRDSRGAAAVRGRARDAISTRISTATTATGARTTTRPGRRSSSRPAGGLTHFVAGPRHERHLRGHRAPAAAVQPGDQADFVSAGDGLSRPRRPEAHGVGDRAGDLRSDARRRGSARRERGRVRHGPAARSRGRRDGGHLVGRGAGGDAAGGEAASIAASSSRCFRTAPKSI